MNQKVHDYFLEIFKFNKTDILWKMPLSNAFCVGFPLFIGAYLNQIQIAIVASMGGMVFLYTPKTKIYHRMIILMTCSFGFIISFTLGLISHFSQTALGLILGMIATLGAIICRFYQVNKPGNFFFIMMATLAAYMPFEIQKLPYIVGIFSFGTMLACLVAFIYSLITINKTILEDIKEHKFLGFEEVIVDPFIIGIFVGLSVFIAEILGFEKPYWVPISCIAIMQGMTLSSTWIRQLQRIIGTAAGIILTWILLGFDLNNWGIAISITVFSFLTEYFAFRNYAFGAIFLTPMTIFMAEISGTVSGSDSVIIITRLQDIILGSVIGLVGGVCLHTPKFRNKISKILRSFNIFKMIKK